MISVSVCLLFLIRVWYSVLGVGIGKFNGFRQLCGTRHNKKGDIHQYLSLFIYNIVYMPLTYTFIKYARHVLTLYTTFRTRLSNAGFLGYCDTIAPDLTSIYKALV